MECTCPCGVTFQAPPSVVKKGYAQHCSRACRGAHAPRIPIAVRFKRSVSEPRASGCRDWTGYRDAKGYGRMSTRFGEKPALVHRVAWELVNGPIPDGMCVLHRCDRPCCVNVEHLFLGTLRDNVRDMVSKRRQARGARTGTAKLTEQDIVEIRNRHAAGDTRMSIASTFRVSISQVRLIVLRERWAHVP